MGFPQGRNYSRGIGDVWHPSKLKVRAATITTLAQKLTKNVKNQWEPKKNLFPLIPTRATTTKLAQKLENIQNQWKPCSTSQLLRRQNVEDMILALLDPTWLCLNMCPASSARRETFFGRLCTADHSCLPFAIEKTIPVSFCQKLFGNPIYLIEFLEYVFLMSRYVRIILYYSEVCWRGYCISWY